MPHGPKDRFFEVYTRGTHEVGWIATVNQDWVRLSRASGHLSADDKDLCVKVSMDWHDAPTDFHEVVTIEIRSSQSDYKRIHVELTTAKSMKISMDLSRQMGMSRSIPGQSRSASPRSCSIKPTLMSEEPPLV